MDVKKKKISDAQKRAQKKYDPKTKTIALKYTPANMDEYEQLVQYLSDTKQSRNSFIKGLIKNYFKNGYEKNETSPTPEEPISYSERNIKKCPFNYIDESSIQFLCNCFGDDIVEKVYDEFYYRIEEDFERQVNSAGGKFDEWIKKLKKETEDTDLMHNMWLGEDEETTLEFLTRSMINHMDSDVFDEIDEYDEE